MVGGRRGKSLPWPPGQERIQITTTMWDLLLCPASTTAPLPKSREHNHWDSIKHATERPMHSVIQLTSLEEKFFNCAQVHQSTLAIRSIVTEVKVCPTVWWQADVQVVHGCNSSMKPLALVSPTPWTASLIHWRRTPSMDRSSTRTSSYCGTIWPLAEHERVNFMIIRNSPWALTDSTDLIFLNFSHWLTHISKRTNLYQHELITNKYLQNRDFLLPIKGECCFNKKNSDNIESSIAATAD